MNRRSFLSMMGFVAPAVIVKPTYFLSPFGGWIRPEIPTVIGAYADYTKVVSFDLPPAIDIDPNLFEYQKAILSLTNFLSGAQFLSGAHRDAIPPEFQFCKTVTTTPNGGCNHD